MMVNNNRIERYRAKVKLEAERINKTFDLGVLGRLVELGFMASAHELAQAGATRFDAASIVCREQGYRVAARVKDASSILKSGSAYRVDYVAEYNLFNMAASPWDALRSRALVRMHGLVVFSARLVERMIDDLAKHEARMVELGFLKVPTAWGALDERSELDSSAGPASRSNARRASL